MALMEHRLDGDIDKVKTAIERIRLFERNALALSPDGYYVAYSGGKDSTVIAELCIMAGVKFELVNNHTTVDPPELVYHVREQFKRYRDMGIKCTVSMPKETMWRLILKNGVPTRVQRFCCKYLKETGGTGRFVITGVRWAESAARKSRSGVVHFGVKDDAGHYVYTNDNDEAQLMFKTCTIKNKLVLNPIIDWLDEDVWEFIRSRNIPYCRLYDEGFKRLGCIGCSMAGEGRKREFERWPTYKKAYIRAFEKMLEARKSKGLITTEWETAEDVFSWWMEENKELKQIDGQTTMNINQIAINGNK